ncbi:single-stranded-DNA-specific exonuclease RecJ [Microbaculum marinisediminis]|uniref:Single-stranded-DNA-specific exonuclease RecJ n=1 Tax=Microbaculum marinisediminis TaxID=2931392 RepID=A0AAW5R1R8_9HYPH|nr:single-stranded-DNA-specific exonuclease RecJ [Microbaculum sp. A6E488]MCT8973077.1 single-stranded-DNA-specific exonuclease RecJ [Microbaculum sp. A6E488]
MAGAVAAISTDNALGGEADAPRTVLGVAKSATSRRWVDRLGRAAHQTALAIAQQHDIPEIVARVVAGRGVGPDDLHSYLDPSLRDLLPDPSGLAGMDAAAERLADAIQAGEKVAIFGDYDVDGATSAALLARFLRENGIEPSIHIPDRITEGYGPNAPAITALKDAGASLLVTVDCGSTSHEALAHAAAIGLDTVVIDHHQIGVDLPPAVSVVNPNRQDDLSGQGHLAAVGVVFLTLVAVNRVLRQRGWYARRREPELLAWLDLVALGTVADVVPLVGLNRAYVRKGLIALRSRRSLGLSALADAARLGEAPDTYHLGFLLGPRINAGGRIGDAALGVRLLLSTDPDEAATIAANLDRLNRERQEIEAAIVAEAMAMVEADPDAEAKALILVHSHEDWHPGVVGLVAARLKERFSRPAIAIAFGPDGTGTGSARSIAGVDIGAAVRAAVDEGLAIKGGGHAMAAGLTVERDRVEALTAFLDSHLARSVGEADVSRLEVDALLTAGGATVDLLKALEDAGPYGSGNPQPVFVFPAHRLSFADATEQGHVRCTFASPDGGRLKAIAFRAVGSPLGDALLSGRQDTLHAAGTLRIDRWGGRETVQLHLRDVAVPARDRG